MQTQFTTSANNAERKAWADTVKMGDTVMYRGRPHRVNSIKVGLIWGPHFRLMDTDGELTSYRLCSPAPRDEA